MKEEVYVETGSTRPAPLFLRRVSWGAIFAGLALALVLQMVLTILGVGVGASSIEPLNMTDASSAKGFGLGAAIWFGISSIISIFFGAWVAGRFSGGPRKADGMLHGLATWAAATLLTVFLLTTAVGSLLGGMARLLGNTLSAAGQTASQAASGGCAGGLDMQKLTQQVQSMISGGGASGLEPTGRSEQSEETQKIITQAQQNPELVTVMTRMISKGGAAAAPQERQAAINILTSNGMSQEEAAATVDRWSREMQQAKETTKQEAREAGDVIATGTANAAWGAFVMLVLCGLAGALGGYLGTRGLPYTRAEQSAAV